MNKDKIKGKIEEIKGDIKERVGGASKDRSTQAEGWVEEKKGQIRGKYGDLKDEMDPSKRSDPATDDPGKDI